MDFFYDKKKFQEKIKANKKMLKQNSQVRRSSGDGKHHAHKMSSISKKMQANLTQ